MPAYVHIIMFVNMYSNIIIVNYDIIVILIIVIVLKYYYNVLYIINIFSIKSQFLS